MRASHRALLLLVALTLIASGASVSAQIIAIGPPSFQSNDFPSLETLILDRLALGQQYDRADLATLSHLTVLESIAMLADIQFDMPNSVLGTRLEGQIRQLWDAAAVFEESVSATPTSAQALTGVQPLYGNMQAAYQQVESTLGGAAGLSNRAFAHLEDIARLTAATRTLMRVLESDVLAVAPISAQPALDVASLGRQARLLANNIVALIQNVKASKHQPSAWSTVTRDLEALFDLARALKRRSRASRRTKKSRHRSTRSGG
jgi:hypothetical protein